MDDIGLFLVVTERNFLKAKHVIARYEAISSASLNLSKSIIVSLFIDGPLLD